MLKRFTAGESLVGLRDEKLADKVLAILRDRLKLLVAEVKPKLANLVKDFLHVCTLEGQIPAQHHVEHDTERPNVRLLVEAPLDDLWGHVIGRPAHIFALDLALL